LSICITALLGTTHPCSTKCIDHYRRNYLTNSITKHLCVVGNRIGGASISRGLSDIVVINIEAGVWLNQRFQLFKSQSFHTLDVSKVLIMNILWHVVYGFDCVCHLHKENNRITGFIDHIGLSIEKTSIFKRKAVKVIEANIWLRIFIKIQRFI